MTQQPQAESGAIAFEHATVITMRGAEVLTDHTVLVRNQRIEAVAPSSEFVIPNDARRHDASNWYLLPGLADMHAHLMPLGIGPQHGAPDEATALERAADYLRVLLAHGVTTARNMAGTPFHLRVRDAVRSGEVAGPRIHTAGPVLESRFTVPALEMFGQLVRTREDARAAVLAHEQAGYDCIKVYNDIDPDVYDEIVATCRERGLKVVGHVAYSKGLEGALAARQDSIEHFRSYDFALDTRAETGRARFEGWLHTTPARIREMAERTAEAGTWNVPTLVVEHAITRSENESNLPAWLPDWLSTSLIEDDTRSVFSREQIDAIRAGADRRLELLAALDAADAPLMAGSDCPACALVPGQSLHDELEMYVEAGLSPLRTLRAATLDAMRFLEWDDELGTLEAGKLADILVLAGDPLSDIRTLRAPVGVVAAGRWWTTDQLRSS
ncbi:MAG TPA: amidohydrolase family protein [Steroidobacteraceae bacterium]|nr:amidohydrolase family protein [Steroidobacteraceae bacterium]